MAIRQVIGSLGALEPEQIAKLQKIFDCACARLDIDSKSEQAEDIAQRLVAAHQSGTLDKETFLNSLPG